MIDILREEIMIDELLGSTHTGVSSTKLQFLGKKTIKMELASSMLNTREVKEIRLRGGSVS